jgi:haloacetate dehalogenase
MARDQVGLMRRLGSAQFRLAGHDRGARVAHRLVLDHPGTITGLAVLDIVPTRHVLHNVARDMATEYYHWRRPCFLVPGPRRAAAGRRRRH